MLSRPVPGSVLPAPQDVVPIDGCWTPFTNRKNVIVVACVHWKVAFSARGCLCAVFREANARCAASRNRLGGGGDQWRAHKKDGVRKGGCRAQRDCLTRATSIATVSAVGVFKPTTGGTVIVCACTLEVGKETSSTPNANKVATGNSFQDNFMAMLQPPRETIPRPVRERAVRLGSLLRSCRTSPKRPAYFPRGRLKMGAGCHAYGCQPFDNRGDYSINALGD